MWDLVLLISVLCNTNESRKENISEKTKFNCCLLLPMSSYNRSHSSIMIIQGTLKALSILSELLYDFSEILKTWKFTLKIQIEKIKNILSYFCELKLCVAFHWCYVWKLLRWHSLCMNIFKYICISHFLIFW